ncbi:hypothetical protein BDQ17DRAFT_1253340 [Cyathus striatus]|nr:hypothetical protein BDQ17DRAFT_1253340 [Cyathus striatus]
MAPYYGPVSSPHWIFLERAFVAGDFIGGVGYGIQCVLYLSCAIFFWKQRKLRKKSIILIVYMTLLMGIQTMLAAAQARVIQEIYIDNRNYPGGPWAYFLSHQTLPINVMFYSTLFLPTFLADLLILWRCWVIWKEAGKLIACIVLALPVLLLLGSVGMGILWTLQSSQPGLSLYSKLPKTFGTTYYAISLSVNIILAILISLRLYMHRRRILGTLPEEHAKKYVSLATIFIESAALYSIFALIFVISYAVNNPINQIFLVVASSTQQIAGYLIIYRIAQGTAWSSSNLEGRVSTLRFSLTTQNQGESGTFRTVDSTNSDTLPQVHVSCCTKCGLEQSREGLISN